MNYQAYLDRIGYTGDTNPTLQTLRELQRTHLLHVPFENLDIHAEVPIELDPEKIYQKVVLNRRGGFCYELNGLFYHLLSHLGFEVAMLSARPYSKEKGYSPEYDHLALLVRLDGAAYLVDVGFGEFSMEPLKIDLDQVQQEERNSYLFDRYDSTYFRLSRLEQEERVPEYIFREVEQSFEEFAGMCHFHQTDPGSPFTKKKLITLPTPQGRITLTGDKLKTRNGSETKETDIAGKEAFAEALATHFNIQDPILLQRLFR